MLPNALLFALADERRRSLIEAAAADRAARPVTARSAFRNALGARFIRIGMALTA